MAITANETELYPIEISVIMNSEETIYDRSLRGKAYFYLILESQEE